LALNGAWIGDYHQSIFAMIPMVVPLPRAISLDSVQLLA
jgi:hypothetical protein